MLTPTDKRKWSDFKESILPNLEALLRFSLGLTVNGRDAVDLLRDTLMEAYQSWDELSVGEDCGTQIQEIMTKRFFGTARRQLFPAAPTAESGENRSLGERAIPGTAADSPRKPAHVSDADIVTEYSNSIVSLPEAFRSAMILSYLEGFSNSEIAGLAGVPPHDVDALLERGREIIREELFAYLMGNGEDEIQDTGMATGESRT